MNFPMTDPEPGEIAADLAEWHAGSEPVRRADRLAHGVIDVVPDSTGRYCIPPEVE